MFHSPTIAMIDTQKLMGFFTTTVARRSVVNEDFLLDTAFAVPVACVFMFLVEFIVAALVGSPLIYMTFAPISITRQASILVFVVVSFASDSLGFGIHTKSMSHKQENVHSAWDGKTIFPGR